tara:strand:+ start:904 stop:1047 length:144 start_codon:yes stop_codon:yes gene_type:complete
VSEKLSPDVSPIVIFPEESVELKDSLAFPSISVVFVLVVSPVLRSVT